ncbi:MGMT family protein [Sanguibacter antarcticus]|uniref:O(6)-alkylguanine repair protein YbaZ n=1 Tax=Sanguibacter antarcticus TaxID=372484 RepID=A0A2A9E4Q1_9MICO|nr:MGMT family protein [Sanguibacter antarcticus]PFG33616.1 O(6)-alkylguanine repair protein YbaZ [Sanguibacter antarcticus]
MDEEYMEAVLDLVETIPAGQAMTYGGIALVVGTALGRGGPRQVGQVLSRAGAGVPWWRVVNAAGAPPRHQTSLAIERLRADGCPLVGDGTRVDLRAAAYQPR